MPKKPAFLNWKCHKMKNNCRNSLKFSTLSPKRYFFKTDTSTLKSRLYFLKETSCNLLDMFVALSLDWPIFIILNYSNLYHSGRSNIGWWSKFGVPLHFQMSEWRWIPCIYDFLNLCLIQTMCLKWKFSEI